MPKCTASVEYDHAWRIRDCRAPVSTERLGKPLCASHARVFDKAETRRPGNGFRWAERFWYWERDIMTGEVK